MLYRTGIASVLLLGISAISWICLLFFGFSLFNFFPSAEISQQEATVDLSIRRKIRCYYLKLEMNFLEKSIQKQKNSSLPKEILGVFDRNGTEFLFEGSPHGRNPLWMEIIQNKIRTVCDSSQDHGFDHRVEVEFVRSGKTKDRIQVGPAEGSKFLLDHNLTVDVPSGGSFITKSSAPAEDSKSDFLWIEVSEIDDIDAPALVRVGEPEKPLQISANGQPLPSN